MGIMYLNGWGVKPSQRQALDCFTIAAQVGHVLGMYNLAIMHLNGRAGLPAVDARLNCPPALALLKKIAEKGGWGGLVQQVTLQSTSEIAVVFLQACGVFCAMQGCTTCCRLQVGLHVLASSSEACLAMMHCCYVLLMHVEQRKHTQSSDEVMFYSFNANAYFEA